MSFIYELIENFGMEQHVNEIILEVNKSSLVTLEVDCMTKEVTSNEMSTA